MNLSEKTLQADEFEVINSHTSVDAPETVYFIREEFERLNKKGVKATINYPRDKDGNHITMWNLIVKKGIPPTRLSRYCCSVLKESSTPDRICTVGVRASESVGRTGRNTFATRGKTKKDALFFSLDHAEEVFRESQEMQDDVWDCTLIRQMKENKDIIVSPIYEWTDNDIWTYIQEEKLKVNPLYEKGYHRVGCVGCPMATYRQKMKEFSDYPTYKTAYINAFQKMVEKREIEGKVNNGMWGSGEEVFDWWIEKYKHEMKGQMSLDDFI